MWQDHPALGPPLALVIDEVARVTGHVGGLSMAQLFGHEIQSRLADVAATVRSSGAHLWMATQYPLADVFGKHVGSLTRFNLSARIVVGASTREGLKVSFDVTEDIDATVAKYLGGQYPGRCLYRGLGGPESHKISKGQIWHLTQSDAAVIAPATPAAPVIDFDAMGAAVWSVIAARLTDAPLPDFAEALGIDLEALDLIGGSRRTARTVSGLYGDQVPWLLLGPMFETGVAESVAGVGS